MTDQSNNQQDSQNQEAVCNDNNNVHPNHGWTPLGAPPAGEECPNCCGGGCTACGGTGWY